MAVAQQEHDHAGQALGVAAILTTLTAWTVGPLLLKHFASTIDVWTSNGWRYAIGSLLWIPVVLRARRRGDLPASVWRRAMVPAVFNSLGQVTFASAFYFVDASIVAFALRPQIIFVAIGAMLLFPPERAVVRSPRFIGGAGMVLVGTALVIVGGGVGDGGIDPAGIALGLAAGFFFAAYPLSVRACLPGVSPISAFGVISLYTAVAMVALMNLLGAEAGGRVIDLGPSGFALLVVSAQLALSIGHVSYYTGMRRLGVATAASVLQLQPFTIAGLAAVAMGERMVPLQWMAGALAVAGAFVIVREQQRVRRALRRPAAPTTPPIEEPVARGEPVLSGDGGGERAR